MGTNEMTGKKKLTIEDALKRVTPEFPRPWLRKHYHETRFFNLIARELVIDAGEGDAVRDADMIAVALAEQNIFPAWLLEYENSKRKSKLDPRRYVLTPIESMRYIAWLRKTRKELKSDDAKAA